jgi:hypothetical protein
MQVNIGFSEGYCFFKACLELICIPLVVDQFDFSIEFLWFSTLFSNRNLIGNLEFLIQKVIWRSNLFDVASKMLQHVKIEKANRKEIAFILRKSLDFVLSTAKDKKTLP